MGCPEIEKNVKNCDVLSLLQAINTLTDFTGNTEKFLCIIVTTITGLKLSRAISHGINLRLDTFRCALQVSQDLKMFEITFASIP